LILPLSPLIFRLTPVPPELGACSFPERSREARRRESETTKPHMRRLVLATDDSEEGTRCLREVEGLKCPEQFE
jgi:hypothetical protein